jgi:hypothetical protein
LTLARKGGNPSPESSYYPRTRSDRVGQRETTMKSFQKTTDLLEFTDDELKEAMAHFAATGPGANSQDISDLCFNLLIIRRNEALVKQTEMLVKKTRWLVFATWAMAAVTILVQILAANPKK